MALWIHGHKKFPEYKEAARLRNSVKVMRALAKRGGVSSFSRLKRDTGLSSPTLEYHLRRLAGLCVIKAPVKGTYQLTYKAPLCYVFGEGERQTVAYFGLLGEVRPEPETEVALALLKKEGMTPSTVYVCTSDEAFEQWKGRRLPYRWIICYGDEILDIDAIKRKAMEELDILLRDFVVIMDCTSATKPATIAYYELAQALWLPLIYVYEKTKELKWLISREMLERRLLEG